MSQIMKAFTGIFMVLLMMVSAVGLLGGFLQVIHAQNLHSSIVSELENSNYAKSVLEESFLVATEVGYDLEITLYDQDEGVVICQDVTSIPESCVGTQMAEVVLVYPFQIPFFEVDIEQEIFGYAR